MPTKAGVGLYAPSKAGVGLYAPTTLQTGDFLLPASANLRARLSRAPLCVGKLAHDCSVQPTSYAQPKEVRIHKLIMTANLNFAVQPYFDDLKRKAA